MVLTDTSVWIDHFRRGDKDLEYLLNEGLVAVHSFVIGELACGNFKNRKLILSLLTTLPVLPEISQMEYLHFVEAHKLYGTGLGFVDIHLLASCTVSNTKIFTRDKALLSIALKLKLSFVM